MLAMIQARSNQGAVLTVPLQDAQAGFFIENIDGLDPVKATLVSSSFATLDGEQYQSSKREMRNIKIRMGLEADYRTNSIQDLRRQLYSFFMPKSEVELRFYDDSGAVVSIMGRVESFESALFSPEPAVDISVVCFASDFIDPVPVALTGYTTATPIETSLVYSGSVETGVTLSISPNRDLSMFTIYHRAPDNSLRTFDFTAPLIFGDILTIETTPGKKNVMLNHLGTTSSMLYAVSAFSNWLQLMPGENFIRVYALGAGILYNLNYTNRYGGL